MFRLTFDTDNSAFGDDPKAESARILLSVINDLSLGKLHGTLRDFNGNSVGMWELLSEDKVGYAMED